MNTIQIIIGAVQLVITLALIALVVVQNSNDGGGISGALGGSSSDSFFGKNKGNTIEAKMSKWTIVAGVIFVALTLALNILELTK